MSIKIVLTGFGSFSGVSLNPTQEIIKILRQENWQPIHDNMAVEMTTDVLEVSTVAVCDFLDKTTSKVSSEMNDSSDVILVCIHLGVDGGATTFKLESTCYNNMTFRVPDEQGFQPVDECIDLSRTFDMTSTSQLPLAQVNSTLQGEGYPVVISTDPGRYLCNYVFFKSLQYTSDLNHTQAKVGSSKHQSLFIHVPPVAVIPLESQCLFIKRAVQSIINSINIA